MTDTSGAGPRTTPPPSGNWWDSLGNFFTNVGTPSDVPAVSLLQMLSPFPEIDPKTGKQVPNWVARHVIDPATDSAKWFFTPHPHPSTTDADGKAKPPESTQPAELLPGAAGTGAGGTGATTGFDIPGTAHGTYPDPPKPAEIPPTDYAKVRELLGKAEPTAPKEETFRDKLNAVLGGLAAGMQGVKDGGTGTGNLLLNLGMGALGGLAGERADYKKSIKAYEDSLASFREKQASTELGIAEQTGKEAQAQRAQDTAYANDLWKYHQAMFEQQQPKVISSKGGVLAVQMRNSDGSLRIETTPIGTGSTPGNIPFYRTQAGDIRADTTYGAGFAAFDHWERTGRLHGGKGGDSQYLFTDDDYKKFADQAHKTTEDERMTDPGMTNAQYNQTYHAHLYELLFNYAQAHGQGNLLLQLGGQLGQQRLNKSVEVPDSGEPDTTANDAAGTPG